MMFGKTGMHMGILMTNYLNDKAIYFMLQIAIPDSLSFARRLWGFLQNSWAPQLHWKIPVCWNYIYLIFNELLQGISIKYWNKASTKNLKA